jgi:amino acid transporter
VLLLLIYVSVAVATIAFAGVGEEGIGLGNIDNASDVFAVMGESVFGGGAVGWIMVHLLAITVLTSASASTQTTILPTARTSLSMAVFKAAPARFARIHPRYLTPTDSTIWMGAASIVFYVGLTLISENILADTIEAVGLMIAFYYGLTGFACVWFYRKTMWKSPRDIVMQGLFPFLGGTILLVAFIWAAKLYAAPDWGAGGTHIGSVGGVFLLGIGSLLAGFVFMFVWQMIEPAYFRGETLPKRDSSDLVLVGGGGKPAGLRLPDSVEQTVIASDLSNLPPGETAIDPRTGKRFAKPTEEEQPPT